ncbi:DUF3472 domain-containing protein [Kitasatospora sp. HPMI-4]|uniref:DUF3472 domain-containing protein n=1 Tax=Kitasatospora sp. HPMI-4 TaxID=3448443 RepID=UPI003F1BF616
MTHEENTMPNADSVYLTPASDPGEADILVSDFSAVQSPIDTYWALQNWNQGAMMGGYAGFQQSSDKGRLLILSIWDHKDVKAANELVYCSPCGHSESFGGEGTGLHVTTPYQFRLGQWYRMAIRCWQDDHGTCVGQWVMDLAADRWDAIAAIRFPHQGLRLGGTLEMFQENWTATGENVREGHIRNSWSRHVTPPCVPGGWVYWETQRAQGSNDHKDWDGGSTREYFWVKAGGGTKPSDEHGITGSVSHTFVPDDDGGSRASISTAEYDAGVVHVGWELAAGQTPQFSREVRILETEGTRLAAQQAISPFCSQANVRVPGGLTPGKEYRAELTVVNLFDKPSSASLHFKA